MQWPTNLVIVRRLLCSDVSLSLLTLLLLFGNSHPQTTAATGSNNQRVVVRSNNTNGNDTPDNIQLTFFLDVGQSEKVSLSLQRNPNIPLNTSTVVGRKGKLTNYYSRSDPSQNCAYYIDPATDASVFVQTETNSDGTATHSYTGFFQIGGQTFSIKPTQETDSRRRRRRSQRGLKRRRREVDSADVHEVQQVANSLNSKAGSPVSIPPQLLQPLTGERLDPSQGTGSNTVVDKSDKTLYVIEVLVVIDYRVYQQMYDLSTESTDAAKMDDTVNRINQYYSHVINEVDLRYRSINVSSFTINARYAGSYIAMDTNSSLFVENNRVGSGSSAYVLAVRALSDFADWVNENKANLPNFDQASLFALDFLNGASGDRISGLAYYGSMCSYWSVLISRHALLFGLGTTAAHEIGHNLRAVHDGIDNTCSAAQQHIMAASSAPLTDDTYKNPYTFSNCSVSEITTYIQTLPPNNCMMKQFDYNFPDVTIPLGAIYSPDAQCAIMYGNGSFHCGGSGADKQICRSMGCFHPIWQYCVTPYEQRALTGTPCGDKMWCYMGDCVQNDKAPALPLGVSADCLYGDSKVPFFDGFQCSNVSQEPWNCYQASVEDSCCKSCADLKDESFIGCEYGDLYSGCGEYQAGALDCTDSTIKTACCQTCAKRSPSLVTTTTSTSTTTSKTTTQSTSTSTTTTMPTTTKTTTPTTTQSTTKTTTPTTTQSTTPTTTSSVTITMASGMQCIDIFGSWCWSSLNFPSSFCYTPNQIYCCNFCASIRNDARPGCEYGDRYTWCDTTRCTTPSESQSCCGSCQTVLPATSTTTTTPSTTTRTSTSTTTSKTTPTTTSTTTSSTTSPTTTTTTSTTTTPSTTRTSTSTTSTTTTPALTLLIQIRVTKSVSAAPVCKDSSSICIGIDRSQCYSLSIRNLCCSTCAGYNNGPPGCEYGDHYTSLCNALSIFNCPLYTYECCETCNFK